MKKQRAEEPLAEYIAPMDVMSNAFCRNARRSKFIRDASENKI